MDEPCYYRVSVKGIVIDRQGRILLCREDNNKWGLRYDVTDHFAQQGFVDIAAALNKQKTTVPTPANKDIFHAADMRLDYVFASKGLMVAIQDIEVVKNKLTDQISDHYPLVLTLG